MTGSSDSFGSKATLDVGGRKVDIYRLDARREGRCRRRRHAAVLAAHPAREPAAQRGRQDGHARGHRGGRLHGIRSAQARATRSRSARRACSCRTSPACPRVVDLAAMRDAFARSAATPSAINPLQPVDLVIDHSVQVDELRHAALVRRERRARVRAQPRALPVPALGPARVQEHARRAARHRHRATRSTSSTSRRSCSRPSATASPRRIPTRSSAPTRTPR